MSSSYSLVLTTTCEISLIGMGGSELLEEGMRGWDTHNDRGGHN